MKIIFSMALAVWASTVAVALGKVENAGLRHRQLACIKKGRICDPDAPNCCGNAICQDEGDYGVCCLEEGTNGCSSNEHCCIDLYCDLEFSVCRGSETDAPTDEEEEPRPCGIHGEPCELTGTDISENDCCGDIKYFCDEVKEPPDVGDIVGGDRCCIPVGGKGCSFTYHCCDSIIGNYCDEVEYRCLYPNGTFPDDSVGLPDCSNEGGECEEDDDCCGNTRLKCISNPSEDPPDNVCCIKSGVTGCDAMDKCCSGFCDFVTSTCCLKEGESDCVNHTECCPGTYCDDGTCTKVAI